MSNARLYEIEAALSEEDVAAFKVMGPDAVEALEIVKRQVAAGDVATILLVARARDNIQRFRIAVNNRLKAVEKGKA